jgi:predicted HicB family RNase H-like nuclease
MRLPVPYRKSVVQITSRFRKDLHRPLAQEAKARDISLNEEIERTIAATKAEKR